MENLKREYVERQAAKAAAQEFVAELEASWRQDGEINPHDDRVRARHLDDMAICHRAMVYLQVRAWARGCNWELYAPESMTQTLSNIAFKTGVVGRCLCRSQGWTWTAYTIHNTLSAEGVITVGGVTFKPEIIGEGGARCWYSLRFRVLTVENAPEPQTSVAVRMAIMRLAVQATAGGWLDQWKVSRSGTVYVHSNRYGQLDETRRNWASRHYRVSNHPAGRPIVPEGTIEILI